MSWAIPLMVAATAVSAIGGAKKAKAQKKQGQAQAASDIRRSQAQASLEVEEANALARAELEAGKAAYEMGLYAEASADFEAKQMAYQSGQEMAKGQRDYREERRLARVAQSRAVAVSAASGGTSTDISIVELLGDIEGYGEYDALTALYEGGEKARGMETAAIIRRFEGKQARKAGELTFDASQQRYQDILLSGRRRAKAILETGVDSANLARGAGNAAASATIWSTLASTASKSAGIADRI